MTAKEAKEVIAWDTLIQYAYSAQMAYIRPEDWDTNACKLCGLQEVPEFFKVHEAYACFGKSVDGSLIISFRGTNSTTDVADDIYVVKRHFLIQNINCGWVHAGFLNYYTRLHTLIWDKIKTIPSEKIIITGHSLGGAAATICALELAILLNKKVECYTFGSPRVGDKTFASKFNEMVPKSVRVVNRGDIITHVPNLIRFRHVNTNLRIGKFPILQALYIFAKTFIFPQSINQALPSAKYEFIHSMTSYIRSLNDEKSSNLILLDNKSSLTNGPTLF